MTDREGGGIKMDKYDVFINRFCKNPRSATAMGELDWQRKVREELFNLFTVGYINRIQACPKCGPKWKKKYAAFKKEAKEVGVVGWQGYKDANLLRDKIKEAKAAKVAV